MGIVGVATATPAAAATGNILPPFTVGEAWSVCQGYDSGTHTGKSEYGLDLVKNTTGSCNGSSAGATVRAPIAGTVAYYQVEYGNLCVNITGGRSYTLTHITSSVTSGSVNAGQAVGTVGVAGSYNNNNVAHIHFQMWSAAGCYNNSVIPFDSAHSARICGAPDLTASGPSYNDNGTWSGMSFTGQSCGSSGSQWGGVKNATFLGANHLNNGQQMHSNQYILSDDGRFVLLMQTDGNLVEYTASGSLWASNTAGHPGAYLGMQSDGNVVIYSSSGTALWSTGPKGIQVLKIQTDGNLVARDSAGTAKWANNIVQDTLGLTYKGDDHLNNGQTLVRKEYLRSSDRRYTVVMHSDGRLKVYAPGWRQLWTSDSGGHANAYLGMQSDGNVVIYTSDGAVWATGPKGIQVLKIQDDGNLVARNSAGTAVWATGTDGLL